MSTPRAQSRWQMRFQSTLHNPDIAIEPDFPTIIEAISSETNDREKMMKLTDTFMTDHGFHCQTLAKVARKSIDLNVR